MKQLKRVFGTMAAAIVVAMAWADATPAEAHGYKNGTVEVRHPWTSEGTGAAGVAIVSMKLRNVSDRDERLVSASMVGRAKVSIVAAPTGVKASAAAAAMSGSGIVLPAGQLVELNAASQHILIEGLTAPLAAYGTISITLMFERSGPLTIDVMVEEASPH